MKKKFDFYFDLGSPASYLAYTQLPKICNDTNSNVNLCPILLGGIFKELGNQSPMVVPAKGKYFFKEMQKYAKLYDVPIISNKYFPINTLRLMRICIGLKSYNDINFEKYIKIIYEAIWVNNLDMNQINVVFNILEKSGFNIFIIQKFLEDQTIKTKLKNLTLEAIDRGVFGAPTFFVEKEMFWGQDRIEQVKIALKD
tara:strand:- start:779 stop:1372 length:594 start_codon:yes stop_codon:yes gene_type:complete